MSSNPSSLRLPGSSWTSEEVARRNLLSHALSLAFAIPGLVLFALDLQAYSSQTHRTSTYNQITITDAIALTLLSIAVLYSTTYLATRGLVQPPLTPPTIYRHISLFAVTDFVLCVPLLSNSCTVLSTRTGSQNCARLLHLDEGVCDGHRRTILKAAGAMGVLASVAIHIRWSLYNRLCYDRWQLWRSRRRG